MSRPQTKFLLDTNLFIAGFRDPAANAELQEFHRSFAPFEYLSAVVVQELRAGVRSARDLRRLERSLLEPFARLKRVVTPSLRAWQASGDVFAALARREGLDVRHRRDRLGIVELDLARNVRAASVEALSLSAGANPRRSTRAGHARARDGSGSVQGQWLSRTESSQGSARPQETKRNDPSTLDGVDRTAEPPLRSPGQERRCGYPCADYRVGRRPRCSPPPSDRRATRGMIWSISIGVPTTASWVKQYPHRCCTLAATRSRSALGTYDPLTSRLGAWRCPARAPSGAESPTPSRESSVRTPRPSRRPAHLPRPSTPGVDP